MGNQQPSPKIINKYKMTIVYNMDAVQRLDGNGSDKILA